MLFDTKSPKYGVVEVDTVCARDDGRQVAKKDAGTDHAVTYVLYRSGNLVVVRTVDILDRSPEARERGIAELQRICAHAKYADKGVETGGKIFRT